MTANDIKNALFFTIDSKDFYKTLDEIQRCERICKFELTNPERMEIHFFVQDNEKALLNKVLH